MPCPHTPTQHARLWGLWISKIIPLFFSFIQRGQPREGSSLMQKWEVETFLCFYPICPLSYPSPLTFQQGGGTGKERWSWGCREHRNLCGIISFFGPQPTTSEFAKTFHRQEESDSSVEPEGGPTGLMICYLICVWKLIYWFAVSPGCELSISI